MRLFASHEAADFVEERREDDVDSINVDSAELPREMPKARHGPHLRGRSPERPPHPLGILDEVEAGEHPEQPTAFGHAPAGVVQGA